EVKSERSSRLGAALKKVGRWLWENRKRIFICLLIVALLVAANYILPDIPGKSSLGGIPFFPIAGSVAVANPEEKVIAEQMVTLHRRMAKLSKKKILGKEKRQPYEFTRRNRRKWSEFIAHYKDSMGLTKAFIKGAYYIYRDRLETDLDRKIFMKELRKLDFTGLMEIDREQRGIRVVLEDLFNGRADEEIKRSLKKAKNLKISEFFSREDGKIRVVDSLLTINDREEDKSDVPEKETSDLMAILKTVKDLERVVQAIELADPLLLVGETGVGKTSLIRALAYLSNNNFRRFNLNGQTDKLEFIGGYRPRSKTLSDEEATSLLLETLAQVKLKDPKEAKRLVKAIKLVCGEKEMTIDRAVKIAETAIRDRGRKRISSFAEALSRAGFEFEWKEGILLDSMRKGHWINLDEINLGEPEIVERIRYLLEPNGYLVISEHEGEKWIQAEDFDKMVWGKIRSKKPEGEPDNALLKWAVAEVEKDGYRRIHQNFRLFATMNPDTYEGRKEFSPALMNKFRTKWIEEPSDEDLGSILNLKYGFDKKVTQYLIHLHAALRTVSGRNGKLGRKEGQVYYFTVRNLTRFAERVKAKLDSAGKKPDGEGIIAQEVQEIYGDGLRNEGDQNIFDKILKRVLNRTAEDPSFDIRHDDGAGKIYFGDVALDINTEGGPRVPDATANLKETETTRRELKKLAKCVAYNEKGLLVGPTGAAKT
ncbi:MAG: AAA family ATPase, partial [Candidatus Omnitrophota bacterium]